MLAAIIFAAIPAKRSAAAEDCPIGAYRLGDGSFVDIGPTEGDALRWRRFDGTTGALHRGQEGRWSSTYGWTDRPDGKSVTFSDCSGGGIDFAGASGHRIAFDVTDTTFTSRDTKLAGRLVLPKGTAKVPVVILLHGSERESALTFYALQRMLPAVGIGVFVYDKRGTGVSGGVYTQDYATLAGDAVAALAEARRLAGPRVSRIGYQAGSQGGWVAPLAANSAAVDFVIVCFGMAVNVIDEDQEAVEIEMRERGHTTEEIVEAQEVAHAAERVFESAFTDGFAEFDAVRAKYRDKAWYKDVHGDFAWFLLPKDEAGLKAMAKDFDWHIPFRYDPMPVLRADKTPQLWILGGEDYDAPSAETAMRIKSLIADGGPFTLAFYPQAEHGITRFEVKPDGERVSTVFEPGYFAMMADFIRDGRVKNTYGEAQLTRPRSDLR